MKKAIALAAMALAMAMPAAAQVQYDAVTGATQRVARTAKKAKKKLDANKLAAKQAAQMARQLKLSKEQKAKVEAVALKYAAMPRTKANIEKKEAELKAILDDNQKAQYAELKNKLETRAKRNGKGN